MTRRRFRVSSWLVASCIALGALSACARIIGIDPFLDAADVTDVAQGGSGDVAPDTTLIDGRGAALQDAQDENDGGAFDAPPTLLAIGLSLVADTSGHLVLAYVDPTSTLFYQLDDSGPAMIASSGAVVDTTPLPPSLAVLDGGTLAVAYVAGNGGDLMFATLEPYDIFPSPQNAWSASSLIEHQGGGGAPQTALQGPAMAFYEGEVFVVYVAGGGSGRLIYTVRSSSGEWSRSTGVGEQPAQYSSGDPRLVVAGGQLYLVYIGVSTDSSNNVEVSRWSDGGWLAPEAIPADGDPTDTGPGTISSRLSPAVCAGVDTLYVIYALDDFELNYATANIQSSPSSALVWSPPGPLNQSTYYPPVCAYVGGASPRVVVAYFKTDVDASVSQILSSTLTDGGWSGPRSYP